MVSYIALIIVISILLILSYYLFRKDIFSPTFLSCLFFDISAVLALIGLGSWNNQKDISVKLILIITVGLISFGLGELLIRKLFLKNKNDENIGETIHKYINVSKIKYILTIIFIILTTVILIKELEKVCIYYGYSGNSLSDMLNFYRMNTSLYNNNIEKVGVDINFIVKQLQKACEVICVIYIFIFINNLYIKKDKKLLLLLIPIFMCMAQSLLTSGRVILMKFFIIFLFMILYTYINKWGKIKTLICSFVGCIILISIFYLVIPLLGRSKDNSPIEYVSFYFGTTIPSFEYILKENIEENPYLGQETFSGVYDSLNKFKILDKPNDNAYIWIDFLGYRSNVYTSLKSYYIDFGICGVIVCQFAFGFLFTYLFLLAKNKEIIYIWYLNYVYILIEQIRAEQFFRLISMNTFAYTFLIVFFYEFFYDFEHIKKYFKIGRKVNEK